MNYELAKQLGDAGWPVDASAWTFYDGHEQSVPAPTLEELIEACGDDFVRLRKSGSLWEAWGYFLKNGHDIHALTPTEAVAMLYLALYGKKQNSKDAGKASRMEGE